MHYAYRIRSTANKNKEDQNNWSRINDKKNIYILLFGHALGNRLHNFNQIQLLWSYIPMEFNHLARKQETNILLIDIFI